MAKIARWAHDGSIRTGFVAEGQCYALPREAGPQDLFDAGLPATLKLAAATVSSARPVPLGQVRLLAPLAPRTMRDFVAFEEHVEGVTASIDGAAGVVPEWYEAPTFYFTNPHTVRATRETVPIPSGCHLMDLEAEVAAVIGNAESVTGTDLEPGEAHRMIFGYTIMNDWSARDVQSREMRVRLGPSKGKDFATTLGPWIVTADEFEARHDAEGFLPLQMTAFINGIPLGSDLLSNMGWPFAELVAYASQDSLVVPGDVLGSGTCARGCLAELWGRNGGPTPPPLAEGDTVRIEVEGIGTIENTVGGRRREGIPASPARARGRSRAGVPAANLAR
ncbi:fumarylacetoacetate hydrolase family protein [Sinomonas sp. JGH33]|uniref:Fumarylacetoacetate hydrolase family protein n=1 Tax=Sinomonas terricola TaxID=3110330 RepID=A0ABU5T682_9MICC|nr:fumarylacetoacetate hydrolase family protein [Sinomonas sp. JGH33]MEA5455178.1 fumarylacetoacetate hydrolase family protein [Sinomonas sp. JGH33]